MRTAEASFRGRVHALSVADVLSFLGGLNRNGLFTVCAGGSVVDLFLDRGRVTYATSTREIDRFSELLLRWGLIEEPQYRAAMERVARGARLPEALVGDGGLTPRVLLEARDRQARQIAQSLFELRDGEFHFLEGESAQGELPPVDLPIPEIVAEGIRALRNLDLIRERVPSAGWVYEPIPAVGEPRPTPGLQPQEQYILGLVDGIRTIGAISETAGFPDLEVRRILFLLSTLGRLKPRARPGRQATHEPSAEAGEEVVRRFNGMFGHVYRYLMREIGPISQHLLTRSLREMQGTHPVLFSRACLGGDGTLDGVVLQENLRGLDGPRRREMLVLALNELLYTELLVLRRTLGAAHEKRVLKIMRRDPSCTDPQIEGAV